MIIAGAFADGNGYKDFVGAQILMIVVIFISIFAQSVAMLSATGLVTGFPRDAFQALTTAYAADVAFIATQAGADNIL